MTAARAEKNNRHPAGLSSQARCSASKSTPQTPMSVPLEQPVDPSSAAEHTPPNSHMPPAMPSPHGHDIRRPCMTPSNSAHTSTSLPQRIVMFPQPEPKPIIRQPKRLHLLLLLPLPHCILRRRLRRRRRHPRSPDNRTRRAPTNRTAKTLTGPHSRPATETAA